MWERKAGYQNWDLFMKLERSRREDFEDTLKLYILFSGITLGRFKYNKMRWLSKEEIVHK